MYLYDKNDHALVRQRVKQFEGQTARFVAGELTEEQFLPLRLQNGLYIQRHAPMLRIAVPYGMLRAKQLRKLAHICRSYDKGYCHITTRQNIQLNWPSVVDVPSILSELADVEMHAIQTSGNCIRNITTDALAGVAQDEVVDSRPYCEILRQWSTLHPEFAYLPRKFKIAISGSEKDRAATSVHDIGLQLKKNASGEVGFKVIVGGGLGRTPMIGSTIREFLPECFLLSYLSAILRVYNCSGRRDNKYKARIKILVKEMGIKAFSAAVEEEWQRAEGQNSLLSNEDIHKASCHFTEPAYEGLSTLISLEALAQRRAETSEFDHWLSRNVDTHKKPGYSIVTLSLKPTGGAPGDITAQQLEVVARLAEQFSFGEVRTTHLQNIILADVNNNDLYALWQQATSAGFATPNVNTLTDIICCPGGDYCALANAKSIPIAEELQRTYDATDYLYDLGDISLNISGCMNACAHHHVANIGILGVDKKGNEFYQITLGGHNGSRGDINREPSLGKVLGKAVSADEVSMMVDKVLEVYIQNRIEEEHFLDTYDRLGIDGFRRQVYA